MIGRSSVTITIGTAAFFLEEEFFISVPARTESTLLHKRQTEVLLKVIVYFLLKSSCKIHKMTTFITWHYERTGDDLT